MPSVHCRPAHPTNHRSMTQRRPRPLSRGLLEVGLAATLGLAVLAVAACGGEPVRVTAGLKSCSARIGRLDIARPVSGRHARHRASPPGRGSPGIRGAGRARGRPARRRAHLPRVRGRRHERDADHRGDPVPHRQHHEADRGRAGPRRRRARRARPRRRRRRPPAGRPATRAAGDRPPAARPHERHLRREQRRRDAGGDRGRHRQAGRPGLRAEAHGGPAAGPSPASGSSPRTGCWSRSPRRTTASSRRGRLLLQQHQLPGRRDGARAASRDSRSRTCSAPGSSSRSGSGGRRSRRPTPPRPSSAATARPRPTARSWTSPTTSRGSATAATAGSSRRPTTCSPSCGRSSEGTYLPEELTPEMLTPHRGSYGLGIGSYSLSAAAPSSATRAG